MRRLRDPRCAKYLESLRSRARWCASAATEVLGATRWETVYFNPRGQEAMGFVVLRGMRTVEKERELPA